MGTFETALLAAYVVFQVKELNLYCGGRTDIFFLRKGIFWPVGTRLAARLDAAFSDYAHVIESSNLREIIGADPAWDIRRRRREVRRLFADLRKDLMRGAK